MEQTSRSDDQKSNSDVVLFSDIFGRRWAFNLTIGITALFGLIAAGSPNFAAIGVFAAFWSFGVGGNLPVDSYDIPFFSISLVRGARHLHRLGQYS